LRAAGGTEKQKSLCSRVAVLKTHLGRRPLDALEELDDINRFKTESDWRFAA